MSAAATIVQPSDDELRAALVALRTDNATLGISKIHALLLTTHPGWTVSEKRTRKALQAHGLMLSSSATSNASNGSTFHNQVVPAPSSNPTRGLRVSQWTSKVAVLDFGAGKGKGLVAASTTSPATGQDGGDVSASRTEDSSAVITSQEVIWKEDPWVVAPEWDIFDLQWSTPSRACAHCTTPFPQGTITSKLITSCPSSSSRSSSSPSITDTHCPARFCNRLCLTRALATHHPLLCPVQNPGGARVVRWARSREWMAAHALAKVVARVFLSYQRADTQGEEEMDVVRGWAAMGMEDRAKCGAFGGVEPNRNTWKAAHKLFIHAFRDPPDPRERKMLAKILAKPIPENVCRELFVDYEAFLVSLGRMSLNMEAHGGLYVLHSHLNHSCAPNISVRHIDTRTALSRITVVARRDIHAGEELTVAYVDPTMELRDRRLALVPWGFGECQCERCLLEEAEEGAKEVEEEKTDEVGGLERELKAGLGLL